MTTAVSVRVCVSLNEVHGNKAGKKKKAMEIGLHHIAPQAVKRVMMESLTTVVNSLSNRVCTLALHLNPIADFR